MLRILWKRFLLWVGDWVIGAWLLRAHGTEQVRKLSLWFKLRTVVRMDRVI